MKTCNIPTWAWACLLAVGLAYSPSSLRADEPTALQLAKLGNKYIGEQSHNKIVQIRSEKSLGSLTPNVWYIVYYDSTAALKAVEVKFGAGKMLTVQRPLRLLEPILGADQPLDPQKIKVDSPAAIQTALKEPILNNLKVTATAPKLERGSDGLPVWKVRVWVTKPKNTTEEVDLGAIILSAETGKVVQPDIHTDRLN